ncbi:MAG: GNAT family N-acetyltransferase [Flavobacteriaceae bacterium]|nr:GNAT family N-acetyltransferase [Flavobacteriaceae bacterium]
MIKIKIAKTSEDIKIIENLGSVIWREHYIPIIGLSQVEYMLEKFQTIEAIENQLKENYQYYVLLFDKNPVGYLSVLVKDNSLFLSKIYVLKSDRGKGIGKFAMGFIQNKAKELKLNSIVLTVNKYNSNAIKAYEKMGFEKIGELVQDIGGGFVMDDYKMEKSIERF